MITPTLPQDLNNLQTQSPMVLCPPTKDATSLFDRDNLPTVLRTFLLRFCVKRSIQTNDEQLVKITSATLIDLQTNEKLLGHNEDSVHFAASINKVPVAVLMLEELRAGHITLDTMLQWQLSDVRAGNGVFDQPGAALQGTVREVFHDLLNRSGNTAVRIFVNKVLGGAAAVNARFAQIPEIPNTRLLPLASDPTRFLIGNTTSKESLFMLRRLLSVNDQYTQFVKNLLATNIFTDIGARSQLAGNDFIVLANKNGFLLDPEENLVHDMGIIYNANTGKSYGFSYMTTSPPATEETATARAIQSLKEMGRYVLRYAGDKPHPQGELPFGIEQAYMPETKVVY